MGTGEKNVQIGALRYRMAQVNDLQNQREELRVIAGSAAPGNERVAVHIQKVDSALALAKTALHRILDSFPEDERARVVASVVQQFGAGKPPHGDTATFG